MTYISRGTRIIDSRYLDECDAEYKLRASRKRSDGRLKRHESCDDCRAWSTNNCINYEYLLDLMSDGESTGKSHVRLYGRYIPLPLLMKILQGFKEGFIEQEFREKKLVSENESGVPQTNSNNYGSFKYNQAESNVAVKKLQNNEEDVSRDLGSQRSLEAEKSSDEFADVKENLWKAQSEKYLLEKRFFECRSLLCKAIGKLEKIDGIISDECEEAENSRNEEIESAFYRAKSICNCSTSNSASSKANLRKVRDVARCGEVLRKISELKQKLKGISERRQEVNEQIRMQRLEKCASKQQVTELFSRREEVRLKRLQKKLEKLVSKKGKLLLELAEAINSLNKMKKSLMKSRSRISFASKASAGDEELECKVPVTCACGCQCTDNVDSSNSPISDDVSQDNFSSETRSPDNNYECSADNVDFYSFKKFGKYNETNPERNFGEENRRNQNKKEELFFQKSYNGTNMRSAARDFNHSKFYDEVSSEQSKEKLKKAEKDEESSLASKKEERLKPKKSKLKFVCPESTCRKKSLSENLDIFRNVFHAQEKPEYSTPTLNVSNPRPYSSPGGTAPAPATLDNYGSDIPERKIKSETTMEEIEKTLRNYEQRLKCLDSIEYKIQRMKEKVAEGRRQREEWIKQKAESKKLRATEREQSSKEITKLCSENWALKKKVRELMAQSDFQMKKIECLKSSKKKLREAECETEELKKELSQYQDSFEGQQKRICMLESCVVNQRSEIEKLTSLVNRLNTGPLKCFQDKSVQRSRSYSPESVKTTTKTYRRTNNSPETKFSQSSEEDCGWRGDEWQQQETRSRQKISCPPCCTPHGSRRRPRCVN